MPRTAIFRISTTNGFGARRFVVWYHDQHRHEGLNGFTPGEVYSGRHIELAATRQITLNAAYAKHPARWINGPPRIKLPPASVVINPAPPITAQTSIPLANEIVPAESFVTARVDRRLAIAT